VTDLEAIVHVYKRQNVAVLAMEYRGFGWCAPSLPNIHVQTLRPVCLHSLIY
jgi:hypothetical protein